LVKGQNMTTYTVTLSDAENKALGFVAVSQDDWIQNAVHERCRVAIEEIVAAEVQRLLAIGQPITGTKEDIVIAAPIKSAAEIQAEFIAEQQQQV
jgi:hypothetical protein